MTKLGHWELSSSPESSSYEIGKVLFHISQLVGIQDRNVPNFKKAVKRSKMWWHAFLVIQKISTGIKNLSVNFSSETTNFSARNVQECHETFFYKLGQSNPNKTLRYSSLGQADYHHSDWCNIWELANGSAWSASHEASSTWLHWVRWWECRSTLPQPGENTSQSMMSVSQAFKNF